MKNTLKNNPTREFYDELGWEKIGDIYEDTRLFVDTRRLRSKYNRLTEDRIKSLLSGGGNLFLDAGCGAKPLTQVSEGKYNTHVGLDFSIEGLKESRLKIKDKGFVVLGDITMLPFKNGCFDGIVSAYVLFHIPGRENQGKAFRELYRVLREGKTGVVIYGNPYYYYITPERGLKHLAREYLRLIERLIGVKKSEIEDKTGGDYHTIPQTRLTLYSRDFSRFWIKRILPKGSVEIKVFRMMSEDFTRKFLRENRLSKVVLWLSYHLENMFPHLLSYVGCDLMIILRKRE